MNIYTWKFPRVIAIKVEKSNEFDIEALALHLTAKVKLYQFFFSWVEAKARHHHVMLMLIMINLNLMMPLVRLVFFVAHPRCCNCHKLVPMIESTVVRTNCDHQSLIISQLLAASCGKLAIYN